jgi:fructose-1,6-bisphosphatase/inositol monophosphatase family enzyme
MSHQAELAFAKKLTKQAGDIMLQYFCADTIDTTWKKDDSPLTIADTTINQLVIDSVREAYPDYGVIGEEKSYETTRKHLWVVDPIDGTIPYSLGIPTSTFCLALVESGVVQLSVVYDPFQKRLYSAVRGQGAFLNGTPIKASKKTDFVHSYVIANETYVSGKKDLRPVSHALRSKGAKLLYISSFTYMTILVATGEVMVAFMAGGSPWDAAAVSLIAQEAGGKATDLNGKPRKYNEWGDGLLITNGVVHDEVVEMIADANPGR